MNTHDLPEGFVGGAVLEIVLSLKAMRAGDEVVLKPSPNRQYSKEQEFVSGKPARVEVVDYDGSGSLNVQCPAPGLRPGKLWCAMSDVVGWRRPSG